LIGNGLTPCPCGGVPKNASYSACCGRYHAGALRLLAPTPEALMRSRYSAYVLRLRDYLIDTWHPSTRPSDLLRFDANDKWLGLEIREVSSARVAEVARKSNESQESRESNESQEQIVSDAFVEFVARSKPAGGGAAQRLHERSRFVHEEGRWWYVSGIFPAENNGK
jgi:SEC-C motif domain protein